MIIVSRLGDMFDIEIITPKAYFYIVSTTKFHRDRNIRVVV